MRVLKKKAEKDQGLEPEDEGETTGLKQPKPKRDPKTPDDGEAYDPKIHRWALTRYLRATDPDRLPIKLWPFGRAKLKRWWLEIATSDRVKVELDAALELKLSLHILTELAIQECRVNKRDMRSIAVAIGVLIDKQKTVDDLISTLESKVELETPKRTKNELKIVNG